MIAVTPTYASIGIYAQILLAAARIIQGLSLGGEYGTSATYLTEMADQRHRGFYSSFQYVTLIGGQLTAIIVLLSLEFAAILLLLGAQVIAEYERIGLIRTRELGDVLAQRLGGANAVMMRGHGITTAAADVRAATVAACFLEESAALQLRMLASAGGDPTRIRAYTPEEAQRVRDQLSPAIVERAWEYFAAVAESKPLGG